MNTKADRRRAERDEINNNLHRVLVDEYEVTFTREELIKVLGGVRRAIKDRPFFNDYASQARRTDLGVWESRDKLLRGIEDKIVMAYNQSGTKLVEIDEPQMGSQFSDDYEPEAPEGQ